MSRSRRSHSRPNRPPPIAGDRRYGLVPREQARRAARSRDGRRSRGCDAYSIRVAAHGSDLGRAVIEICRGRSTVLGRDLSETNTSPARSTATHRLVDGHETPAIGEDAPSLWHASPTIRWLVGTQQGTVSIDSHAHCSAGTGQLPDSRGADPYSMPDTACARRSGQPRRNRRRSRPRRNSPQGTTARAASRPPWQLPVPCG